MEFFEVEVLLEVASHVIEIKPYGAILS